ncbi:MAG: hypothetical protein ABII76_21795 [Pseudomonadota bacterium]
MTHDPMLVAAARYRAELAAFDSNTRGMTDADSNAFADRTWGQFYSADPLPEITTPAGAIMALRVSVEENAFCDSFAQRMAEAALAVFERHYSVGVAS